LLQYHSDQAAEPEQARFVVVAGPDSHLAERLAVLLAGQGVELTKRGLKLI
jgi:hypothetical protein